MKTIYREKRYYCGEYLDVYIFPTYRQSNGRRSRSKPTTAAQKKLNQRHREEKLVRLLHANFTPDDLEIHLTYTVQPESEEEAARNARNYIRRIQRMRKKAGLPPLKYIVIRIRIMTGFFADFGRRSVTRFKPTSPPSRADSAAPSNVINTKMATTSSSVKDQDW